MAKTFGENERRICSLFTPGTSFNYRGLSYTVKFADKLQVDSANYILKLLL